MATIHLSRSVLQKAVVSGGGGNFAVPRDWSQMPYGSGSPIMPIESPEYVELPRTIDYPISVNATIAPRTGYPGLVPFSMIRDVYNNVAEVRAPVGLIIRELSSFEPHLIDKDGNEVPEHDYAWMCHYPDRKTPYGVWLTRFLKSAKVYDAPALYLRRDNSGNIDALYYIDGSTLFVIIDENGNVPDPEPVGNYVSRRSRQNDLPSASLSVSVPPRKGTPSTLNEFISLYNQRQSTGLSVPTKLPAYTQVIKGTPFSWWSSDQIWYRPQSLRMDAPYGETFIEAAWSWIMIIVNITAFELGHYRTGNMPEGILTVPKEWWSNPDALLVAEEMYNYRMSNGSATERQRLRLFPDGSKYIGMKKPDFPDKLYNQAWKIILHEIGIPPSEFGDMPGGGLGGKGFKEGAASDLSRNTLNPHRGYVAQPFNDVLRINGVTDVTFELGYPTEEIDPDKLKQSVYELMTHGSITLNDGLGQLGLTPVGDPNDMNNIANKHLITAGSAIYVLEDMQVSGGMAIPTFTGKQSSEGTPTNPEDVAENDGKEHTPEDVKTLTQLLDNLIRTGTLDGKTISVPSGKGFKQEVVIEGNEATPAQPPLSEIRQPLNKHCGVCCDEDECDDDYFGAPISRDVVIPFPDGNHVNGVDIVAAVPDGLPPKPMLFKPEGGENEWLRERVGGPLYVREEAVYLIDRSLGFFLVPVTWVAEADDEEGAVVWYSMGNQPANPPDQYDPKWTVRAAVLDYVISQQDRKLCHNYLTVVDEPDRPLLYDNGYSLPENPELYCESLFCAQWLNQPLPSDVIEAMRQCKGDASAWADVQSLIGKQATQKALTCLQRLIDEGMITSETSHHGSDGS